MSRDQDHSIEFRRPTRVSEWIDYRLPIFTFFRCELHEYPRPGTLSYLWNFVRKQIEVPMSDGDVRTCAKLNLFPSRPSRGKADSRPDEYRPSSAQLSTPRGDCA